MTEEEWNKIEEMLKVFASQEVIFEEDDIIDILCVDFVEDDELERIHRLVREELQAYRNDNWNPTFKNKYSAKRIISTLDFEYDYLKSPAMASDPLAEMVRRIRRDVWKIHYEDDIRPYLIKELKIEKD